ncbi:threonine ammonia-lyase [Halocatena pleomorpha]|uniref:threonine ammonia-lyase n=1 Tax=Halocatena pleomorpha TaxID=1785090 RepID=A0A3P3RCH4_9EURY|nr:threonine ammonia-lyase [Halocatena pleomorpha]RRJ31187.1 threonine ammonia-lyase [Halocatena pleomorpha]
MLSFDDVFVARDRIEGTVQQTPLERSNTFSQQTGADIRLKLELFQRTGAFKLRGATNRIKTLSESERAAGVVTASAGNHAQGVALAASRADVDSTIVMPEHAPISKVDATEGYGGTVVLHGRDYEAAQRRAHAIEREEDRTYLHAFDDPAVMAGQGTIGLEIMDDCPEVDTVVVPIGGGGLIAGVATAIKGIDPDVRVIGVQAKGAASAAKSFENDEIVELNTVDTIADGIATRRIGEKPFEVIRERVDSVVTVSDAEIAMAISLLVERSKVVVEGAGATALAAVLADAIEYESGETIVPLLSGGNIDPNVLTTVLMRGLVQSGRYVKLKTVLKDQPGALMDLTRIIADNRANVYGIQHDRTARDIGMGSAEVVLDLETRGPDHVDRLIDSLEENGYPVEPLV